MKSYLIMAKHVRSDAVALIPLVSGTDEVGARNTLGFVDDAYGDAVEWAVAYEFSGDDFRTVAHYER